MRYSELDNLDKKEIKTNTEQDEQLYYLKYNQQVQYLFDLMNEKECIEWILEI